MSEIQDLDEAVAGIYFNYACRALLGGGKGRFVMLELYGENPEGYRYVIAVAKKRLVSTNGVSLESVEEQERILNTLTEDLDKERGN